MKLKSLFTRVLFLSISFCLPLLLVAQGLPDDPGVDPDLNVPFDGGLSLLIGAGIAYGAKKAHDKRKKNRAIEEGKKKIVE